jgi:predicted peroxiredoxin
VSHSASPVLSEPVSSPRVSSTAARQDMPVRRRKFLTRLGTALASLPLFGGLAALGAQPVGAQTPQKAKLRIMMKSAWGSDDPTKAAFPFLHGLALAEAGHEVQIFLLGEAVSLMRASTAQAVVPVGWPALEGTLEQVVAKGIQIYACGACSRARGITEADLAPRKAKFGNPTIFVSLVEWADRIITE